MDNACSEAIAWHTCGEWNPYAHGEDPILRPLADFLAQRESEVDQARMRCGDAERDLQRLRETVSARAGETGNDQLRLLKARCLVHTEFNRLEDARSVFEDTLGAIAAVRRARTAAYT